jgi:hypothetical protein
MVDASETFALPNDGAVVCMVSTPPLARVSHEPCVAEINARHVDGAPCSGQLPAKTTTRAGLPATQPFPRCLVALCPTAAIAEPQDVVAFPNPTVGNHSKSAKGLPSEVNHGSHGKRCLSMNQLFRSGLWVNPKAHPVAASAAGDCIRTPDASSGQHAMQDACQTHPADALPALALLAPSKSAGFNIPRPTKRHIGPLIVRHVFLSHAAF